MSKPVLFQNMPPLSPEEYSELEASIKEHGIQVPIIIDEDGVVIDGHHRQKIAQELGIRCPKRQVIDKTESEKRTLALSLNVHRRHLNREQKRALIAESLKADPQLPDLQHAHRTGASPHTVKSVRTDLESDLQIANDTPRVNARGQERPASYERDTPEPKSDAELLAGAGWTPTEKIQNLSEQHLPKSDKILGPDGKQYPRPEPQEPQKRRRNPLPEQFFKATYDLQKNIERMERLIEDDRFQQNKEQIALRHKNDLLRSAELLQELLHELD